MNCQYFSSKNNEYSCNDRKARCVHILLCFLSFFLCPMFPCFWDFSFPFCLSLYRNLPDKMEQFFCVINSYNETGTVLCRHKMNKKMIIYKKKKRKKNLIKIFDLYKSIPGRTGSDQTSLIFFYRVLARFNGYRELGQASFYNKRVRSRHPNPNLLHCTISFALLIVAFLIHDELYKT